MPPDPHRSNDRKRWLQRSGSAIGAGAVPSKFALSLPYTETGTRRQPRRERSNTMVEFTMTPQQWATVRRDDIHLAGIDGTRAQLKTKRDDPVSTSRS